MESKLENNNFLDIATFFSKEADRTLECLTAHYEDVPHLVEIIYGMLQAHNMNSQIYGSKVLLKPNWVRHSLCSSDEICLRTHASFLLAVLEAVLRFRPFSIVIGDAPVQSAIWAKIYPAEFARRIDILTQQYGVPVLIKDFRKTIFRPDINLVSEVQLPAEEFTTFDVGKKSYLEMVSTHNKNPFRVTCYNPDRLSNVHRPGTHKYCITNELLDVDIVLSLPKVKTHQKTGVTAALKNLVGLNGDKDCLPHHRVGGTRMGGDCYPGGNWLRFWAECALDSANRNRGLRAYRLWLLLASLLWKLSLPQEVHQMAAGWYGNDTTWRMVLDINLIARYGKRDGTLSVQPQRKIYSFCDGIVGGQGNGPLDPVPLPLGVICFSDNSYFTDRFLALLMGFDANKLPLLNAAKGVCGDNNASVILNSARVTLEQVLKYAIPTQPPPGWLDHI